MFQENVHIVLLFYVMNWKIRKKLEKLERQRNITLTTTLTCVFFCIWLTYLIPTFDPIFHETRIENPNFNFYLICAISIYPHQNNKKLHISVSVWQKNPISLHQNLRNVEIKPKNNFLLNHSSNNIFCWVRWRSMFATFDKIGNKQKCFFNFMNVFYLKI